MTSVFVSYSHKDESLRAELETHLAMLKRQGVIDVWHDHRISPGAEVDKAIDAAMERAQVIVLLISPDVLNSDYCYDREMKRAMERHDAGDARVLPVIMRPCDWHDAPFGRLKALPYDAKPVVKWPTLDDAFLDVVKGIKQALRDLGATPETAKQTSPAGQAKQPAASVVDKPRSANLRVRQTFSEADKDTFIEDAFEFMARYFEGSLAELQERHKQITTRFRRIDALTFTAVIYRDGEACSRCCVRRGGGISSNGITYSMTDTPNPGSFNESLSVVVGEQSLFLHPLGMQMGYGRDENSRLTFEGAAEFYWSILITPLQR
jgi:hypothetical protein